MSHPYLSLPPRAFWKTGVSRADTSAMPGLYDPKVTITRDTRIATAGSCFAQHIGRALQDAGCSLLDAEPAPAVMSDRIAHRFGYRLFSGRYGNIYTARQLSELLTEIADGDPDPRLVWENDGRFRDALRPTVEPEGLATPDDVLFHRDYHLARTSQMLQTAEVFVFTLGLTEAWIDTEAQRTLPLCPGVSGGTFDPSRHHFHQFTHAEILADLAAIRRALRRFNPEMQMILSISPVPLTATASDAHVLAASVASKSTLRSAVAEFIQSTPDCDYMPSYEIVTHPGAGGPFFASNHRSISAEGIARVMNIFLTAHGLLDAPPLSPRPAIAPDDTCDDDAICDEILLGAFAE